MDIPKPTPRCARKPFTIDGADARVAEAVALVEQRRDEDGRWPLDGTHADHTKRLSFDLETEVGKASRWDTLRALRMLDWYGCWASRAVIPAEEEATFDSRTAYALARSRW